MRNTKYIYLLLISFFIFGCDESFLDKAPLASLSSNTFWQNENDVQSALAGCYAPLTWGGGGYASALFAPAEWDGATDNGHSTYNYGGMQSLIKQGINPNSGGFVPVLYDQSYQAIAAVNDFIHNIERVELSTEAKNKYLGEVRFIRGLYYYLLARTFGNVPLVLDPPNSLDPNNPLGNSDKSEIIKQIYSDADFAIANLPEDSYTDGHAVKGSAQALKMHTLLLENKFAEAAVIGDQMIQSGKYSLAVEYNDNFTKPGQNGNPEILFSVKWNPPNSSFNPSVDLFLGVWQAVQPSEDLISVYETINGVLPSEDPEFDPDNPYENRDPRLKKTVFTPGDNWGNLVSSTGSDQVFVPGERGDITGFAMKKFLNLPFGTPPSYSTLSDQDWLIFRYADILLMHAEALNESEGPTPQVYSSIN